MQAALAQLTEMSNRYGANVDYVIAGGGNTSWKDETTLYVKPSGVSLKEIKASDFIPMDRARLHAMLECDYPQDDAAREALALEKMLAAVKIPTTRRPSVEALLHSLFPYRFILHIHPAKVNGLTCSNGGRVLAEQLFGDAMVWVDGVRPGYTLAAYCKRALAEHKRKTGRDAQILLMQNHGIFYAADTVAEIDALNNRVMRVLTEHIAETPDFSETACDAPRAAELAPAIRMLFSADGRAVVRFVGNVGNYANDRAAFEQIKLPSTPDHIVYCKAYPLFVERCAELEEQYAALQDAWTAYVRENGFAPKVVAVEGLGFFACGKTPKDADTVRTLLLDGMKIDIYARSFGGRHPMTAELTDFIIHWEAESYRSKLAGGAAAEKRMAGKIAVVTGAAQGFGKGIAQELAEQGAYVVVADMNTAGAQASAAEICAAGGAAMAVTVNVSEEDSVRELVQKTVLEYGGLDVFVSCAGVVRAGDLEAMTKKDFEFVTAINYTGYFLCAKYASRVMKIQHRFASQYYMDIIEINSKSGIQGSNKNFAYAGSKFGGVGLTQSFALELASEHIKVNAVCPGNFYDGPLWADPEKGLFRQYLDAGKVPGAKTVADVRAFYESKTPMGRGCRVKDVARAIFYIVEQEFETGQAVPVTGGQAMLK